MGKIAVEIMGNVK